jgi:protein-S-isoprenylcysteine O-methyltransferase Ste14
MMPAPWWKNSRGELFVVGQFALFSLIIFGPRTISVLPAWSSKFHMVSSMTGVTLIFTGIMLATAGTFNLGRNLTPFICPKAGSVLLEQGAYRLVRHPIYSGILQMAFGWGLWVHGWLTIGYAVVLFIVLILKSRQEEKILLRIFPEYRDYCRRVRGLIPFIY